MMSLNALALLLVAILLHTSSGTRSQSPLPTSSIKPLDGLLDSASSRQGFLRKHPYPTARKAETLSLNPVRNYLRRYDDDQGTIKQRYLQEKTPITKGFHRARVWLEVGYHRMPPELGMVLLIIFIVLVTAFAACCCVTPCFYVYDHYLQHHRCSVSEQDSKVADDSMTMKRNQKQPTPPSKSARMENTVA
jgi:hypothetical protein